MHQSRLSVALTCVSSVAIGLVTSLAGCPESGTTTTTGTSTGAGGAGGSGGNASTSTTTGGGAGGDTTSTSTDSSTTTTTGTSGGGGDTSSTTTSTTGSSGGGGTGGSIPAICNAGDIQPCYTGPFGTQNVGACIGGLRTCNDIGDAYGPCVGEVKPQPETCNTPFDDDCNGETNDMGIGCACAPSTVNDCYGGPPGTAGVGICKEGIQTCNAQGTGFGQCTGEVVPLVENCNTPQDEDCNGQAPPCGNVGAGAYKWAEVSGSVKDDEGNCAGVDANNNVFFGGYLNGSVNFGCAQPLAALGVFDSAVIVKYTPAAGCVFNRAFGDKVSSQAHGTAIATDPAGNSYFGGDFAGDLNPDPGGPGMLTACPGPIPTSVGGSKDIFVIKLDPQGNCVWQKTFGDAADQGVESMAFANGQLVMTGWLQQGVLDFKGGPQTVLTSTTGQDAYVAKLAEADGGCIWAKRFGGTGNQVGRGVAIAPNGDVVMSGSLIGSAQFGGTPLLTSAGLSDTFLARLDMAGVHLWSKIFGDAQDQNATSVATDAAGNVYAAGQYAGSSGLGLQDSVGGYDAWVAKFTPLGVPVWAQRAFGPDNQRHNTVTVDFAGTVAVMGGFLGSLDFDGDVDATNMPVPPVSATGLVDAHIAKYSPDGKLLWFKRFGDVSSQVFKAAAVDSVGNLIGVGVFFGGTDFGGGGAELSNGGEDIGVAKFAP